MPYKDPVKFKAYQKWYRETHKKERNEVNKKWRKNNKNRVAQYSKKWAVRRILSDRKYRSYSRDKLFEILGGKECVMCGFNDERALHFDHIKDNGSEDRKRFGHLTNLYRHYIKNPEECKENLQVLCANCNWIKKHQAQEKKNQEFIDKHNLERNPTFFDTFK